MATISTRRLGIVYDASAIFQSVVGSLGVPINVALSSISDMLIGDVMNVDLGNNFEQVTLLDVGNIGALLFITAKFTKTHGLGIPIYAKPNIEPQFGNGQDDFLTDIDAVAQIIRQRLLLFQGEWWEDLNDGLPLWQTILGTSRNNQAIDLAIGRRILGTPYVTGISNVQSGYVPSTRAYSYSATVQTQFGEIQVTNIPTPPNRSLPL